jgi:hypothetical protein
MRLACGGDSMNTSDPPFGERPERSAIEWREFWDRVKHTLPERIEEADLNTLNSALELLFGRLREARAQFDNEGDEGRLGAFTALAAFWQFITLFRTPYAEKLHVPILHLQDALGMLDQNLVKPILRPAPHSGRAPSSNIYATLKGQAAATVQLLLRTGLARPDAHKQVAKLLARLGARGVISEKAGRGTGAITATTVRNWVDEVSSDVGRHKAAAAVYDMTLAAEQEKLSNMPKDQARGEALGKLAHWVRSMSPDPQKPT